MGNDNERHLALLQVEIAKCQKEYKQVIEEGKNIEDAKTVFKRLKHLNKLGEIILQSYLS